MARRKNHYFTKVHEEAILKYCNSSSAAERNQLYIELIGPAFNEMVDKIVYTYKFVNLPNIDCLKDDCKHWLITILDKYDPNRGSKAFSYFSVITKNWFIHKVKKTSKQAQREVLIEDYSIDGYALSSREQDVFVSYNTFVEDQIRMEFWSKFAQQMHLWESLPLRANEKKVLHAIKILFEESENIEIFNKKAIYLYIREITNLNTKQVVSSLNKIRVRYREFKSKWDEE
tara:strand:+ start:238 stop:927 length:690 start_codon:yes stop_codon:yes gene_type:complete